MPETERRELLILSEVHRHLECATSVSEVKVLRDQAEAVRQYVKSARLGLKLQNQAAEAKLRAERKAGQMLASLRMHGGPRRSTSHRARLKLQDLGISFDQSARWQREAAVPDGAFEEYVRLAQLEEREVTSAGLLRLSARTQASFRSKRERGKHSELPPGHFESDSALISSNLQAYEISEEAQNHNVVLAALLLPFCEQPVSNALGKAEREHVSRLLRQQGELLAQLNRLLRRR